MTPTRESVYVALFNLLTTNAAIAAMFVTRGRWLRPYQQVKGNVFAMPALFVVEHPGETQERIGKGISPKRTLRCALVLYFATPASSQSNLPATQCNNALDAIDDCLNLPGNPQNTQTLGGLVEHVYIEGAIEVAEGLIVDTSIVTIPITILIP